LLLDLDQVQEETEPTELTDGNKKYFAVISGVKKRLLSSSSML